MSELEPPIGPTVAAQILASRRITPEKAVEVRHLTLRVTDPAFQFIEGQSIGVVVPGPHPFGNPYHLRRYSIAAVCGIAQEDDDANGSVGRKTERQEPDQIQGLIAPILAAADMPKLKATYDAAYKAAKTQEAKAAVIAAKDRRKAELLVSSEEVAA